MITEQHVTEELSDEAAWAQPVDYRGREPEHPIRENLHFLNCRLADAGFSSEATLIQPDIAWTRIAETSATYDGHTHHVGQLRLGAEVPSEGCSVAMLALHFRPSSCLPSTRRGVATTTRPS